MIVQLLLPRAIPHLHPASAFRLLALLGLFLLPMQMRAGTDYVHPHALLHLLLDAHDSEVDHHHGSERQPAGQAGHGDHSNHAPRPEPAVPDLPSFDSFQMAAGGLAVALVVVALLVITRVAERVWPRRETWTGHRVLPELPPPRQAGA